jgi:putative tryptophan/tyrosine transport system substrate-binding protein
MAIYIPRREFIVTLGGAAAAWPLAARAQPAGKIPRIGVLWHAGSEEEEAPYLNAFRQGLNDLGYVEPKNIALENRFAAEQYERFDGLAAELVRLKVDVLVAVTQPAALAAQRATTTMPIVFILVADPVSSKLVKSLAHPGGNITGLSQLAFDMSAKRVELLKKMVPSLSRIALLVNPSDSNVTRRTLDESRMAADHLSVTLEQVEARAPSDIEKAFSVIVQSKFDGVVVTSDPMLFNERRRIGEWAIARGLPTMMFNGEMPKSGGLMSYSANNPALFRRAAALAVKILQGAKPADLPVELPTKFELVININTAKSLGLRVPDQLLAIADRVIE